MNCKTKSGEECVRAIYDTTALLQDAVARGKADDIKKFARMLYCLAQQFSDDALVVTPKPKVIYVDCGGRDS